MTENPPSTSASTRPSTSTSTQVQAAHPEPAASQDAPPQEALLQGAPSHGAQLQGAPSHGAPSQGTQSHGAQSQAIQSQGTQSQRTLSQRAPSRATSLLLLSNRAALILGLALALAVTDPTKIANRDPVGWLLDVAVLVGAIWAAPVIAQRPASTAVHWTGQLARHRNTVFAVSCVIIAGFGNPPVWQMIVDAALLLAYLLTVDALAAGPIGIRQLRRGIAPAAAAAASAVALLAAHAPVDTGAVWGRAVAAVAVAAAGLAAGSALWIRQHEVRQPGVRPTESGRR